MSPAVSLTTESPLGLDDLKQLMRSVNETTERLHDTHAALQRQVARLQQELTEANEQLRRSRSLAALGEMAAGIAHEVRNPLASIGLYAQMLAEDVADRDQPAALCEKISRAVEGIDAIVRDVLLFARDRAIQPGRIAADEVVNRALAGCESLLSVASVTVKRQRCGDVWLDVDSGLFAQALANVVRNAVEAMVESGASQRELSISVCRAARREPGGKRADRIVFEIADTGPGISPHVLQRMFNPFFTTRKTGTGLGLAIVHRIVDAHGGHVTVLNRPEGGTIVELCLPPGRVPAAMEPGA